ncbi:unnamed protein product [Absidia cylindrospora]
MEFAALLYQIVLNINHYRSLPDNEATEVHDDLQNPNLWTSPPPETTGIWAWLQNTPHEQIKAWIQNLTYEQIRTWIHNLPYEQIIRCIGWAVTLYGTTRGTKYVYLLLIQ